MKKLIFIFLVAYTFPIYAGYGWYKQTSNTTNTIGGVYMFDINKAIVVGFNGLVRTTTNGGANWMLTNIGVNSNLHKVCFVNSSIGTIVGEGGLLLNTSNGGAVWNVITLGTNANLNEVTFVKVGGETSNIGFITASNGDMYKSTNGGVNWSLLNTGVNQILIEVNFVDLNTGYAVGYNGTVIKTTNGGNSWSVKNTGFNNINYYGVSFIDENTGIICGGSSSFTNGYILKTTDGGETWIAKLANFSTSAIHIPVYHNAMTISVVGNNGVIMRSYDAGNNWTIQSNQSGDFLYYVNFADINNGIAVGKNGCIVRTNSGGLVSVTQSSQAVPESFALYQNYPNPFNPSTKINFDIKNSTFASLKIFDMAGKEVQTLITQNLLPGSYEITFNAGGINSGVYFYTLKTNEFTETKKMILVK
ncbi:MAG: T9SS type A sorting domain-containing protein [Bacteroidetes bacterium]|nr:T9SS type A sorting domain-containing protein [Bacteroidota bacterium]